MLKRLFPVAVLLVAGFALARGRKGEEESPTPASTETQAQSAEPAPPLFPSGLPTDPGPIPEGLASISAQSCAACHLGAHATWNTSAHAQAWKDPLYQRALTSAGQSTICLQCHLPLKSQHDRLPNGYIDGDITRPTWEANPDFDLSLRAEGVSCAACHVREGSVIGLHASPDAPHPVKVSTELGAPEFCATCHQLSWPGADRAFYDTYGEWKNSFWATAGVGCTDCHMAPVAGALKPGESGLQPAHDFAVDPERALTVLLKTASASAQRGTSLPITLTVKNTGAGHAFPTGNPAVSATIQVTPIDSAGQPLAEPFSLTFVRTTASAPPFLTTADTRLLPGAETSVSHSFTLSSKAAAGAGFLDIKLISTLPPDSTTQIIQRIPFEFR
jgi:hypothetical protein